MDQIIVTTLIGSEHMRMDEDFRHPESFRLRWLLDAPTRFQWLEKLTSYFDRNNGGGAAPSPEVARSAN